MCIQYQWWHSVSCVCSTTTSKSCLRGCAVCLGWYWRGLCSLIDRGDAKPRIQTGKKDKYLTHHNYSDVPHILTSRVSFAGTIAASATASASKWPLALKMEHTLAAISPWLSEMTCPSGEKWQVRFDNCYSCPDFQLSEQWMRKSPRTLPDV